MTHKTGLEQFIEWLIVFNNHNIKREKIMRTKKWKKFYSDRVEMMADVLDYARSLLAQERAAQKPVEKPLLFSQRMALEKQFDKTRAIDSPANVIAWLMGIGVINTNAARQYLNSLLDRNETKEEK